MRIIQSFNLAQSRKRKAATHWTLQVRNGLHKLAQLAKNGVELAVSIGSEW
jgi:hypothetical protein